MSSLDKSPTILALIPARKGSKGLPGKNSKHLGGLPLVCWTLIAAGNSKFITKVIVTTDDPLILEIADNFGVGTLNRPPELCTDLATAQDVIGHALSAYSNFDYIIYLQPTSPFRSSKDIDAAITMAIMNLGKGVVSVKVSSESPELMYHQDQNGDLVKLLNNQTQNRQEFSKYYILNGAIYIAPVDQLSENGYRFDKIQAIPYLMSNLHSLDIDTQLDFEFAEKAISEGLKPH